MTDKHRMENENKVLLEAYENTPKFRYVKKKKKERNSGHYIKQ
jgi:hypothetical protein